MGCIKHHLEVQTRGCRISGPPHRPLMLLMSGIVMAVTPSVSQLRGAGQIGAAGAVVRQALWIAVSGGIALAILLQKVEPVYRLVLKVPLNWLFMYGDPALGVPAMGGRGCGWATANRARRLLGDRSAGRRHAVFRPPGCPGHWHRWHLVGARHRPCGRRVRPVRAPGADFQRSRAGLPSAAALIQYAWPFAQGVSGTALPPGARRWERTP